MAKYSLLWLALNLIVPRLFVSSYAITGIKAGVNAVTGQRPFRQEFSIFQDSGAQFDLYIQALQRLQNTNQTAMLSYFQVCGIHGYPNVPWDGVVGYTSRVGYCTHSSILFPTWHRPYLALYEQLLWEQAQKVAATYNTSEKATYQAAAKSFRMPYWDWSLNATMPTLVNVPIITIKTPKGVQSVPNPLYNYTFHPLPGASDFPQGDGIFSSESDYAPFSNTGFYNGTSYNSLENLHNSIHALVGMGGHMGYVPYSAFDPIFWLHHTNVDRLTAIWQALYPNSFTTAEADSYGTYTNPPGGKENATTPLTPFHSDCNKTLYTSDTARYTSTFGYAYPEVQDWKVNATQLSANVRTIVNSLYDPSGSTSKRSQFPPNVRRTAVDTNPVHYQWAVDITADVSQISASLFLHFYVCTPPSSPSDWSSASSLVASFTILKGPSTGSPLPALHGQLPLTHSLSKLNLPDLRPDTVSPYLQQNLQWRAQTLDGSVVAPEILAGAIKYLVVARQVRARMQDDEFPVYGVWKTQRVTV
ncbi:hypothetical protein MMC13_006258 [Lambiella insularis]|nr:hypothetical protein [Lambiella insularis]